MMDTDESEIVKPAVPYLPTIHQIVCDEPWFSFIRKGIKPVEGRKILLNIKKCALANS